MEKAKLSNITRALYIKLGRSGDWEDLCLKENTLRLGYGDAPHEFGNNYDALKQYYIGKGTKPGASSNHAGQILNFYKSGPETLWITFSDGFLWWCIADSVVEYLGNNREKYPNGSRLRRTSKWHNTDINGKELIKSDLSGRLTKTEAYRMTICEIKDESFQYLMRKIKGEILPESENVKNLKADMLKSTIPLMKKLTPQDFELLVDLIFTQGGWQRIGKVGGTEKTADLELLQPMTGERAIVQVKSETNQRQLEDYIQRFEEMPADRYFYAYHTSKIPLENTSDSDDINLTLLGPDQLAEHILNCGLLDWLLEKVG